MRPKTNGKHTNSFMRALSILIEVKGERERERGGQATIGKNILVERKRETKSSGNVC